VHKNIFGLLFVLELKVENWTLFYEYNQSYQKMTITKVALLFFKFFNEKKIEKDSVYF
jgi:hypothetical protein